MIDPQLVLTADLVKLVAEIDEFKGRWAALGQLSPERLTALRKVATVESVGSSTRIEGAKLTDAQVETLLANLEAGSFTSRDEQEVAGYAEAMDLVFEAYDDLRPTESTFRQLHQVLLRHSVRDERHRGLYKTLTNNIVALDADGRQVGILFETSPPFATPKEMEDLVAWTEKAFREEALHPLLITAVFVVTFLAIHPFQDGNGRLSRVLTTLLLLRSGYAYVPYASLESVIEDNKEQYYKALRRTQMTLANREPDWTPWVGFFLRCLKRQKDNLERRLEAEAPRQKGEDRSDLPTLSLQILAELEKHGRRTISELVEGTGANRNTVKLRLRELVEGEHIERHGQGRSTWYARPTGPRTT